MMADAIGPKGVGQLYPDMELRESRSRWYTVFLGNNKHLVLYGFRRPHRQSSQERPDKKILDWTSIETRRGL